MKKNGGKKILSLLFCLFVPGHFFAQKSIAVQYNGWYIYTGNHQLSDKISLHTEYQWRRSEIIEKWQQNFIRFGLDYRTTDNSMFTAGYAYAGTYPYGAQPAVFQFGEHRIWEQLVLTQRTGRFYFHHRYRLEQRWVENLKKGTNGEKIDEGFLYKNRGRYRFMASIPLTQKEMANNTLFLSLYDEIFVNFGKNTALNVFDQNRLYAALGLRFNTNVNIQFGYLNQYIQKGNAKDFENNHTLQLWFTYNFDFRRKETE